jgi:hypothetical protein
LLSANPTLKGGVKNTEYVSFLPKLLHNIRLKFNISLFNKQFIIKKITNNQQYFYFLAIKRKI